MRIADNDYLLENAIGELVGPVRAMIKEIRIEIHFRDGAEQRILRQAISDWHKIDPEIGTAKTLFHLISEAAERIPDDIRPKLSND